MFVVKHGIIRCDLAAEELSKTNIIESKKVVNTKENRSNNF